MAKMFDGRTILVFKNQNLEESDYDNLVSINKSTYGNQFLEFNTISDAKVAFDTLNSKNIKCKYSNYYLFIRFPLEKNTNKEELLNKISENLTSKFNNLNILNINLYEKNEKMLGFGQIVLDRLEDIKLILADNQLELSEDNSVSFYKFNRTR